MGWRLKDSVLVRLQALVYDILLLEEGAGKRCSESVCWYQFLSLSLQFHMHVLTSSSVIAVSKVQEFVANDVSPTTHSCMRMQRRWRYLLNG